MIQIMYKQQRKTLKLIAIGRILFLVMLFNAWQPVQAVSNIKMPIITKDPDRFGAYYDNLSYSPDWDAAWRIGFKADVIVQFNTIKKNLVFWHGTNYIPFWAINENMWYSDGAVVREGAGPYYDRICRHSFVSVVEDNDARVVVRWRYAPVDKDGKLINTNPMTNWSDWVDEFYTIYPDATYIRKIKLHSTNWNQQLWCQQSIIIGQPEQTSVKAEMTEIETTSGKGHIKIVELPGIQAFHAVSATGKITNSLNSNILADWPVSGAVQKPECRFYSNYIWEPYEEDRTSKLWLMLAGLSDGIEDDVNSLVTSWLSAPKLDVNGEKYSLSGYDTGEKAYQITCEKAGEPSTLNLTIKGSSASPIVNPAFVVKGWGKNEVIVKINGKPAASGMDFRYGFCKTTTASNLILWFQLKSEKSISIEVRPVSGRKE